MWRLGPLQDGNPHRLLHGYRLGDRCNQHREYEYEVQVPTVYICTVTLENFNLSHLPVYMMDRDHLSLYAPICPRWETGKSFAGSSYVDRYYGDQYRYEIPADALGMNSLQP